MKLTLYGLKNCDTCRKALKWLADQRAEVDFRDVRVDGIDGEVLRRALSELGPGRLLNTRSTTWRSLPEEQRGQEPLTLLVAHPTLMKRPLVVAGDWLSVGWDSEIMAGLEACGVLD